MSIRLRCMMGFLVKLSALVGVFSYTDWPPVIIVYNARLERANPEYSIGHGDRI